MTAAFQVMPDLDAKTEAALRDSIRSFGVLVPIVVDQNGQIIDGHNRWRIADELDVPIETTVLHIGSDEEGLELARTLNEDRRHLTADQRATVAVSLRSKGHSLRSIAGALGVSHKQVRDDLGEPANVQVCTDYTPARVNGVDGKSYPAKKRVEWKADELRSLLERVNAGESRDDLCTELGITRSTLGHTLTRARRLDQGAPVMSKLNRLAQEDRGAQIAAMAADGYSSRQIAAKLDLSFQRVRDVCRSQNIAVPADDIIGKTRRIDSNRILGEVVISLEAEVMSVDLIDLPTLDASQIEEWATSLGASLRALTRFHKQLKEMTS